MTNYIEWHLIQFTADMRRREPKNIGVAATDGRHTAVRLFGVHSKTGEVDGRILRKLQLTKDAYAPWAEYYRLLYGDGHIDHIKQSQRRRPTEFRMIVGGYTQTDEPIDLFTDRLFSELVSEDSPGAADYAKTLRMQVEMTLTEAQVAATPDVAVVGQWGESHRDDIEFDYSFTNGQLHLMDRLQLHRTSVEQAKMVARDFNARARAVTDAGTARSFIAFYSQSVVDEFDNDSVLAPLWRVGHIIDVDNSHSAANSLLEILHA